MSRRHRARGPSPPALFTWRSDGDVEAGEARVNPLSVRCPHPPCHKPIGEACPVAGGAHPSRRDAAEAAAHKPTETPPSAAVAERTERS